ncbi:cytochrome P450 2C5-like isoform X2 [Eleutherodactylus coqui]|uniref:cytochrome P450 2C5-like isoform X2 n=1 Tax=Eleutherodactylus coqui TaxID=57060 RepID=UPI0034632773
MTAHADFLPKELGIYRDSSKDLECYITCCNQCCPTASTTTQGFSEDMLPLDPVTVLLSIVMCIFLAAVLYKEKEHVHPNYPPGPKPLPIIGNILNLNVQKPHLSFQELAKKYGPVFSIKIGVQKVVVLCGYDTVKEALINHAEEFSDRPSVPSIMDVTKGYGIGFTNGNNWKTMRQFTVSTLRDFGMGKRSLEEKINEESNCLVQMFKCYKGEPFDNTMVVHAAVANIIVSILLGQRFDYNDPKLQRIITLINNIVRILGSPMALLYNAFPSVMRWIPGSHQGIRKNTNELHSFIREIFMKKRDQLDINDQRSLIDCFLVKQKQEKPNPERYFHDENLISLLSDLFTGGMETTGSTLRWSLLLMMKYPEIQKYVQKEIEKVIGLAEPQMAHRQQMPYTDAVIHEIQRFVDILPNNVPRSTTQDVTLKGCFLPKGTYIIPSLTSVLRDAKYFKKPDEFYPQHFLDADGNFVKIEAFLPFSAGKRGCAGATMAKMELFLFFTKLLQNFTFKVPPGAKLDLSAAAGFIVLPQKHEICAISRN